MGVHFDPAKGKKIDEPFQVTSFEYPGSVVPNHLSRVELSIAEDKLVVNMEERSGSIWMLDNVDQ